MESNYWFYTLSAIPQTLAAMVALAAMFVVSRLDVISNKINENRIDLRRFILLVTARLDKDKKEIHEIEPLSDNEFLKLYEKGLSSLIMDHDYLGLEKNVYEKYESEMFRIINREWKSRYSPSKERVLGYLIMKRDIFKKLLSVRQGSLLLLVLSLVISSVTIGFSLYLLPGYSHFQGSWSLVHSALFLALLSIFVTSYSVWIIASN